MEAWSFYAVEVQPIRTSSRGQMKQACGLCAISFRFRLATIYYLERKKVSFQMKKSMRFVRNILPLSSC